MDRSVLTTDPNGLTVIDPHGRAAHVYPYQVGNGLNVYAHVHLNEDPGTGRTYFTDIFTGYQITGGSRADLLTLREVWAVEARTLRLLDHPRLARDAAAIEALDALLATSTCPAGVNSDGPCYADPHSSVCTCTHPDA